MATEILNNFHAHLDVCKHCEQNPFDLCSTGAAILNGSNIAPTTPGNIKLQLDPLALLQALIVKP